ncbi:MAG: EFR1 family ferrodoxin [Lachnospiraceae bacterium]|nr:EFR1 family ferrodoxin [Lachnospiraceae bacterium]
MQIKAIHAVFFSPVGHTKNTVLRIAYTLADLLHCDVREDDYTLPAQRQEKRFYDNEDLVVFGVPVYAGRIPNKILPFVQTLFEGNRTPAVAMACFGNRSYDEALKEIGKELSAHGMVPFAAAACVTPHVMSNILGAGRPDASDLEKEQTWIRQIFQQLKEAKTSGELHKVRVAPKEEVGPYYRPLEEDGTPADFLKEKPVTDTEKCDLCGICASCCPMGSIDREDITKTPGICIKCHACIRKCPTGAKSFDSVSLASHIRMLEKNFARKAEAVYL